MAASVIQQGFNAPKSVGVISLAEQTQYGVASGVMTAKSSQSTAKLFCDQTGIYADFYKSTGATSRRSNAIGYSLDAASRTVQGTANWRQTIVQLANSGVSLTCPPCGQIYITSDGSVLRSGSCSELSYTFTQLVANNGYASESKVMIQWTGFGELYARQIQVGAQNNPYWAFVPR